MSANRNERIEPWWCNWDQFRPFPHMAVEHAEAIRKTINSYDRPNVLEWGCGGSTIWLWFVANRAIVTSVEHDRDWMVKVEAALSVLDGCKLFHRSCGELRVVHATNLAEYTNPPTKEFDVAIVDGLSHWRPDCILACRDLVKPGGHIFLHDSQRQEYSYAKTAFLECEGTSLASEVTDDLGVSLWHALR